MKPKGSLLSAGPGVSKLHAVAVAGAAAVIGVLILLAARASTTQLYLTPASGTYASGSIISVDLRMNSGTEAVNAVEAYVTYAPDLLEYVSTSADGGVFDVATPSSGAASGVVTISRGSVAGISGDQKIATVVFRALKDGPAAVSLGSNSVLLSAASSANIAASFGGSSFRIGGIAPQPVQPTQPVPTPAPAPVPLPVPPAPGSDTAPPTVSIRSPLNGSILPRKGRTAIAATATDDVEVVRMEVLVDGRLHAMVLGDAISANWNVKRLPRGSHTVTVRASDAAGNTGSAEIKVIR